MRFSKPSPAMIVALVALVFAMTGTGFAAKSALIDGAKIKNGSVTGKKLAADAVAPKGYDLLAVPHRRASGASRTAKASDVVAHAANSVFKATLCADGTIVVGTPCPQPPAPAGTVTPVAGPTGPPGSTGTPGASGTDAALPASVRVTIPGGSLASVKFAPAIGTGSALGTYQEVQMVTPDQPIKIGKLTAEILTHGASQPAVVGASLLVDGVGVAGSCEIVTAQSPKCTYDSPVTVPAGSKIAWSIQTTGVGFTAWDSYDLSFGYQSTVG